MPQAPDNLRRLFSSDRDAWEVLKNHFTDTAGVIRPHAGYGPDLHDLRAVDYLCLEWDYAYEPACGNCAGPDCHCVGGMPAVTERKAPPDKTGEADQ